MKFVLSEDEYVEAGLLHTRPRPRALAIGFGAVALFGFGLGWNNHNDVADGLAMAIAIGIGYGLALVAARRWQIPRKLRALYRQHRASRRVRGSTPQEENSWQRSLALVAASIACETLKYGIGITYFRSPGTRTPLQPTWQSGRFPVAYGATMTTEGWRKTFS